MCHLKTNVHYYRDHFYHGNPNEDQSMDHDLNQDANFIVLVL